MITWRIQKPRHYAGSEADVFYGVGDCLSTDAKPTTGVYNGSFLLEMDTSKTYRFNADSGQWVEVTTGSGGGGGGGGDIDEMTYEEAMEVLDGSA